MTGWGIFLIVLFLLLVFGAAGWFGYAHLRARRLGLPPPNLNPFSRNQNDQSAYHPPAPAPNGIQGWVTEKWNALRNKRTAGGAYENTGYGGARNVGRDRRGFGPLDPDGAWDARVGNEADYAGNYYEEQELGLQDPSHGPYGGGGYGEVGVGGIPDTRGRSRSRQREVDARYDEEMHGGRGAANPFSDNNVLRAASPRPVGEAGSAQQGGATHKKQKGSLGTQHSADGSPTERRSMFHEDV